MINDIHHSRWRSRKERVIDRMLVGEQERNREKGKMRAVEMGEPAKEIFSKVLLTEHVADRNICAYWHTRVSSGRIDNKYEKKKNIKNKYKKKAQKQEKKTLKR